MSRPVDSAARVHELVPQHTELFNAATGELLPATINNAAQVLEAARTLEATLRTAKAQATAFLVEESRRQGTKTLRSDLGKVELSGGPFTDYDTVELMDALRKAGCPEDRISEAVREEISYKVNRSVLRQLVSANSAYKTAAEGAELVVERPWRARVADTK